MDDDTQALAGIAHAADAKGRATQQLAKGNLTPEEAAKVRHKANVVLGETDSTYHGGK